MSNLPEHKMSSILIQSFRFFIFVQFFRRKGGRRHSESTNTQCCFPWLASLLSENVFYRGLWPLQPNVIRSFRMSHFDAGLYACIVFFHHILPMVITNFFSRLYLLPFFLFSLVSSRSSFYAFLPLMSLFVYHFELWKELNKLFCFLKWRLFAFILLIKISNSTRFNRRLHRFAQITTCPDL